MSICKLQIEENGCIYGEMKIEAVDDALWVDGIVVDETFYQEVAADLWLAINTWYFDFQTETFINRPPITAEPNKLTLAADGIDSIVIAGLPIPCTVIVDEQEFEVEDGGFEFAVDFPGTYQITLTMFPYIDKTFEVIAI